MEGYEEKSVSLNRALHDPSIQYSTYTCRILATLLYHECTSHTMQTYSTITNDDGEPSTDSDKHFELPNSEDFARTHMRLDNRLSLMLMALPTDLANPSRLDGQSEAAPIVLKLHSSAIAIHRKLTTRLRSSLNIDIDSSTSPSNSTSDLEAVLAQLVESSARMLVAADQIYSLLVSTSRDPVVDFSNVFVTFGAFMASFAFLEDFATTHSAASEVKLGVLMDLLVEGAEGNSMAASLAVQLGHEAYKSGMDRAALGKVTPLVNVMCWLCCVSEQQDLSLSSANDECSSCRSCTSSTRCSQTTKTISWDSRTSSQEGRSSALLQRWFLAGRSARTLGILILVIPHSHSHNTDIDLLTTRETSRFTGTMLRTRRSADGIVTSFPRILCILLTT